MSMMDKFGKYDDGSGNVEDTIIQRSDVFDSQSCVSEYFNHAHLPSSKTSLSQDLNQPDVDSGADFLSDFFENNGSNQDSQAAQLLDSIKSNPGDSVWASVVIASDGSKRKRGNPQDGDFPYIYKGAERTTGADDWQEDSVRQRKLQNRKYSKNSRQRIKDKITHLEEMTLNLECVAEIYRKALTVLFKRWRKDNNLEWVSRKISWYTSSYTGNEECKEVECLLPNIDDNFIEELGNASCGKILNATDPPDLVGNQPSFGDKQNVPIFNKTDVFINNSTEVSSVSADVEEDLNVGIQHETFRLHTNASAAFRGVDSVRSLDASLAHSAPVSSLQDVPFTSSDPSKISKMSFSSSQLIRLPATHQNLSRIPQVSPASTLVQPDRSSSTRTVPRVVYVVEGSHGRNTGSMLVSTFDNRTNTPAEQQGTRSRIVNFRTSTEKNWSLRSLSASREPEVDDIRNLHASLDVI